MADTCSFVGWGIIVQKESISRAERSWTNPLNAFQAIRFSFIKFCIYCFSFWYEFCVHYALRVEKIINMFLMGDLWNLFLRPRGYLTNPFRTLSLCFGVTDKTPGLISRNNFAKKILSASVMAIMSWQDVTRSFLSSDVKECGMKRAHNFLFPKSSFRMEELESWGISKVLLSFLMQFDGNFLLNQQQQQVYLSSSRFCSATSLVIFYQLPSVSKSRVPLKNV